MTRKVIAACLAVALIPSVLLGLFLWLLYASLPAPLGDSGGCPGTGGGTMVQAVVHGTIPSLTAEQSGNARIIIREGVAAGVPTKGLVVALVAASQESGLRNLNYGDRDSLGLFQMRPSMGWGTPAQVTDPVYASRKFYSVLQGVTGWDLMSVPAAAQAVERSGFPGAYAQWEPRAWRVVRAAVTPPSTSVQTVAATSPGVRMPGLQPVTQRAQLFIRSRMGFAGIIYGYSHRYIAGTHTLSEHAKGLALDMMTSDLAVGQPIADYFSGPAAAQWGTHNVIWKDRIWTSEGQRWKSYGDHGNPTLNHMDHVHVDFLAGGNSHNYPTVADVSTLTASDTSCTFPPPRGNLRP